MSHTTRPVDAAEAPSAVEPHTPWGRALGLSLGLAAIVAIFVLAFLWPSVTAEPKDIPVGISAPAETLPLIEEGIASQSNGALELHEASSRDAAVAAIERRETYGAIVLGPQPEILTASAGNAMVTQMLVAMAPQIQAQIDAQAAAAGAPAGAAPRVTVTDIAPLMDTDPRGAGIAGAAFPLIFGGMIGGILITLSVSGVMRRVVTLLSYSAIGGLVIVLILQPWLQVIGGGFLVNWAAFALSLLAIGAPIVGLASLVGRAGILMGPLVFLLFANPISGATMPKEMIVQPWGQIGQWFPPGAEATLVRDLSYFPSADASFPWLVLAGWAAAGLLLAVVGHYRSAPQVVIEPDPSDA